MKVVFLCARYYPSIGGVERHVQEIAERLMQKGHEVHIVCESADAEATHKKNIDGITITYLYFGPVGFFKKFRIWSVMIRNISLFISADVVHIHDVFFWYLPIRFLLFFKPVFSTFHGYEGVVPPTKKAIFQRRMSEFLSQKTIEVGAYIQKWYGTHPTSVIYGGCTFLISPHSITTTLSTPLSFVLIGRLSDDIGLPLYVEFFAALKKKRIPYQLDVYGDGPYSSKIAQYGKVHGFIDDLMKPIINADIVCASSYLTMIDALSCGKTVIAFYNNPLKKDYLESFPMHASIIATDKVVDALQKVSNLTESQSVEELVSKAHAHFSWDTIVKEYLALWKK